MSEYGIFCLLIWRALAQLMLRERAALLLAGVLALLYAVSDEFHQKFVPGRTGEPRDVAIDSAGIIIAILFVVFVKRWRAARSAPAAGEAQSRRNTG